LIRSEINTVNFWNKVDKTNDCWVWTASCNELGYGHFGVKRKINLAHRVSWVIHNGQIPNGMLVCHRCDNPPCVRPDHLFLGTNADNSRDSVAKKRRARHIGTKNGSNKLTEDQIREIRKSYKNGEVTFQDLADKFNVSNGHISRIVHKQSWKDFK
jgi:HNH endonuclease